MERVQKEVAERAERRIPWIGWSVKGNGLCTTTCRSMYVCTVLYDEQSML